MPTDIRGANAGLVKTADDMGKYLRNFYTLMNKYTKKNRPDWRQELKKLRKKREKYTRKYKNEKLEKQGFQYTTDIDGKGDNGWAKILDEDNILVIRENDDGTFCAYKYGVGEDDKLDVNNLKGMSDVPYEDVDKVAAATINPRRMNLISPVEMVLKMKDMQNDYKKLGNDIPDDVSDEAILNFCKQNRLSDEEIEELGVKSDADNTPVDDTDVVDKSNADNSSSNDTEESDGSDSKDEKSDVGADEKSLSPDGDGKRCQSGTADGQQCKNDAEQGSNYCWRHQDPKSRKKITKGASMLDEMIRMAEECTPKTRCAYVKNNRRCRRNAKVGNYCSQHAKMLGKVASLDWKDNEFGSVVDMSEYGLDDAIVGEDATGWYYQIPEISTIRSFENGLSSMEEAKSRAENALKLVTGGLVVSSKLPTIDEMRDAAYNWEFHGEIEDNAINFLDFLIERQLVDYDGADELYDIVVNSYPNYDTELDCSDDFIDWMKASRYARKTRRNASVSEQEIRDALTTQFGSGTSLYLDSDFNQISARDAQWLEGDCYRFGIYSNNPFDEWNEDPHLVYTHERHVDTTGNDEFVPGADRSMRIDTVEKTSIECESVEEAIQTVIDFVNSGGNMSRTSKWHHQQNNYGDDSDLFVNDYDESMWGSCHTYSYSDNVNWVLHDGTSDFETGQEGSLEDAQAACDEAYERAMSDDFSELFAAARCAGTGTWTETTEPSKMRSWRYEDERGYATVNEFEGDPLYGGTTYTYNVYGHDYGWLTGGEYESFGQIQQWIYRALEHPERYAKRADNFATAPRVASVTWELYRVVDGVPQTDDYDIQLNTKGYDGWYLIRHDSEWGDREFGPYSSRSEAMSVHDLHDENVIFASKTPFERRQMLHAKVSNNFATAPRIPDDVDIDNVNNDSCPLCGEPNFDGEFCTICGYEIPPEGFDDIQIETPENYDEFEQDILEEENDSKPSFDPDEIALERDIQNKADELADNVSQYEEPTDDEMQFA